MDCHCAHVCLIRQGFNFDQFALYDDTAHDYVRDCLGCIHTWGVEHSALSYLQRGKQARCLAWVMRHLSGWITYIRCVPDNSLLTSNINSAIMEAERIEKL